MLYSKLFGKTSKTSKQYDTKNAALLEQAGFVRQLMAGVYTYLPLGLRVLNKIAAIVRQGMNEVDGQEILMPILHPADIWKQSGGWDNVDVLFKLKSRADKDYALGQSEEEVVTPLIKDLVTSYKDLPIKPYQIHWKYRDELRAKSGIMRGREFLMKDMYGWFKDQNQFDVFYEQIKGKYLDIYKKVGLTAKVTEASGGAFSKKISYEFMVLTDAGEDNILYCEDCDYCVNQEIAKDKGSSCPKCKNKSLKPAKASEVGNIFDLGNKYQESFNLSFLDQDGKKQLGVMGCYGLGISRLMGVIVEKYNDEKGIIWPEIVAPYQFHLLHIGKDENVIAKANALYKQLLDRNIEIMYDDRDISAGEKLADSDLIGIPTRILISAKTLLQDSVEIKKRDEEKSSLIKISDFLKTI